MPKTVPIAFHKFAWIKRLLIFFSVFGPATITAMADNDATGVATYSISGAKLGYPILFLLPVITLLLGITQEMGIRLALVTRKGLADLIRERFGIKVSILIFTALFIANIGTITVNLTAVKTMSQIISIPQLPALFLVLVLTSIFVIKGNYKSTQNIMLISCLFYLTYLVSAFKAKPDWSLAVSNLIYPHGIKFTATYWRDYLFIGMGVLGTTITPWGQFFISSFAFDKKIKPLRLKYSQLETYLGAFLTDFFSFFMIVATAATLFVHQIPLLSGEQAALAIKPFAGNLAGFLFAVGILNAGIMGMVIIALSTTYAFSEFFGLSGSLDESFTKSRLFYLIFIAQLLLAFFLSLIPGVSLFKLAVTTQFINAIILPLILVYLIKLTSSREVMGQYTNNKFQHNFATIASVVIVFASIIAIAVNFLPH
jgi:Mn2+/Fe2+ NRAMP family transporter